MSKWEGLKGKYPDAPVGKMSEYGADASFLTKVNMEKDRLREVWSGSAAGYMQEMKDVQELKDALNDQIKETNVRLEALSQLLKAHFEEIGVTSVKSDVGRTFYIHIEPLPSIVDKAAFERHMTEHPELEYLWIINAAGVKTLVKDMLEEGRDEEVPPCISILLKSEVRSRKS